MSAIVTLKSVSKAFAAQQLFTNLDLVIGAGDRIGLIGPNGSGKSTLLRIISGLEDEDGGAVEKRSGLIVSYLAQDDRFQEDATPLDNLLEPLAASPLPFEQKLNRAQALLSRIELADSGQPVAQLSGGWRKRVSICRALMIEPDLLVLDEPTNHLDIEGIVWLEQLIGKNSPLSPPTCIMVSHDRQFLENCTNRIVELSSQYPGGIFQVDRSYSYFLEKRAEFLDQQQRLEEKLANKVRRETEWLRRGPKARTTKAKYRIDEAYRLSDRLDTIKHHNRAGSTVAIDFTATGRKTKKLLEVRHLGLMRQGTSLFSDLSFTVTPGTRIGLVGRNGCGKSSLLNLLYGCATGGLEPDEGTVAAADGLAIVNFVQDRGCLDTEISLRRALAPEGDSVVFRGRSVHVVSWAKRFLFRPDQLDTPVGSLSGGEQARILIAELMRQPADILLLDEPTNDLDIASLDVLEESLQEFGGAVMLVTHDRYLLDRVCDQVLGFTGDGRIAMYGDYEQWLNDLEDRRRSLKPVPAPAAAKAPPKKPKGGRLTYLEQREYEQIEERIMAAELSCGKLEQQIEDPALAADPAKLQEVWAGLDRARAEIERLYARWDELERKKQS
jgi:ATP-binding cassette subfamily F protein uup